MATSDEVDRFLESSVREGFAAEVTPDAKETVSSLLDWYGGAGYSPSDLAKALEDAAPTTTIREVSVAQFTDAAAALANPVVEAEDIAMDGPSGATKEQMLAVLATALAADVVDQLDTMQQEWMAALTTALWDGVRPSLESEINEHPEIWGSQDGRAALHEAAYYALMEAADGLCDQIESEGGYVAILKRADS